MADFFGYLAGLSGFIPIIRMVLTVAILYLMLSLVLRSARKRLLAKAKTKKQISNVEIFTRFIKYIILVIVTISAILSYAGSWAGLGITAGLVTAFIGWGLQRPIAGIGAWFFMMIRRPFNIGDRITIGAVKGDIINITLSHIYIKEVGGNIVEGEENSGRMVMVPNSIIFEQIIVNYNFHNDYVLDQVSFIVTRDSNLDEAIEIALESAKKHVDEFAKAAKREPYTRTFFQPNGISIHMRYFSPAHRLQEFSSALTKEIAGKIIKSKRVKFAG